MDELLELREYVEQRRYTEAIDLIAEMEEMSREDKINKVRSFTKILLLHLIKQMAEKRTTRSWNISIRNAVREINYVNCRRKAKGTYLSQTGLSEVISEAYVSALDGASLEAFGGLYDEQELGEMVNQSEIEQKALALILGN